MAQVTWTDPALEDLNRIAEFIASDSPDAASALVERVVSHVAQLSGHPKSGPVIPEFRGSSSLYRQIVEPPCRVFYRLDQDRVFILNVVRGERRISKRLLKIRFQTAQDA